MKSNEEYWASLPKDEFLNEAHAKIHDYYDDLEATGLYYLWEKSYRAYYGSNLTGGYHSGQLFDSADLKRSGKAGQIINLKTNHYRNLLQHSLQLATSQRPAFTCRATNTDYKSQAQCILGRGLVDYYMKEKKLEGFLGQAVENALVFSEGWIHSPWNPTTGEEYGVNPETGAIIYEGDIQFSSHTPLDIPRDVSLSNDEEHDWLFVRNFTNKFDLAANQEEFREEILSESSDQADYEQMDSFNLQIRRGDSPDSSRIPVWTFYHRRTPAMPNGRMVKFTKTTVLFDGPIPYRKIPLYAVKPENLIGTSYGYSPAFELLGPQQALDMLSSTIMTNQGTNGVQNLWSRRGDDLSVKDLGGAMKHLQSDEMPQALQLTATAPEIFNFRNQLIQEMETLSGISSTVRGNPEANLKSGAALALVVSQSIQFASLLENGHNTLIEDIGTAIISHLRDFSQTKRVANILGESSRPFQKEFSGDDLSQINRVVVERTSALSKTVAGRIQLADTLLEKGLIETPRQYIMVLTTGQLDSAIEGSQHSMLNIRAENEELQEGRQVEAVVTENHAEHIREHKSILENPDAKNNPELVQTVLAHIQQHLELWRSADPAILMITGQQPPPPPAQGPQGPPPQGPQPGAQAGAAPDQAGGVVQAPSAVDLDSMPSEPNLPINPLTGNQFDPETGGL